MKPYYEDDLVTLWHGDCREVAAWLDADVLVTDPPYGTEKMTTGRGGYGRRNLNAERIATDGARIANDSSTETRDAILSMWGGAKPMLLFGSPRLPDPPGEWADRLVWDKRRPGINGGPWRYRHESIYVSPGFIRVDDRAVSIIEAHPDKADQALHIHAKPIALMLKLVAAAPPGIIADPFAGSGATLAACKQLGRRAIGVEVDEAHCKTAIARLAQDTLFGGVA